MSFSPEFQAAHSNKAASGAHAGQLLLWALALLVLVRLVSLTLYPLMDNTESRYADIARRMVERSDWITPWFSDTAPFWGKPPLSFWATALGFKLFGINEFGARLPHYLLGAGVATLVWQAGRSRSIRTAWHATVLLAGSTLFTLASGAVMTDMALTLGTTLVMVGFWRAVHTSHAAPSANWQLILGISIGLLAKGPIALILCATPLLVWTVCTGNVRLAWQRIAWLRAAALVLLLSLPWYVWAEVRTPGFLQYFIVGEHLQRFLTPGWAGDLYGSAHKFQRGSIWLFALVAITPWPLLLLLIRWRTQRLPETVDAKQRRALALYGWCWALAPCLFFTFAGNILWTYVLPGLPALALLAGGWTAARSRSAFTDAVLSCGLLLCSASLVAALIWGSQSGQFERRSARSLVRDYAAHQHADQTLYFLGKVPFSGAFYSGGKARSIQVADDLPDGTSAYVVLSRKEFDAQPQTALRWTAISQHSQWVLALRQ